MSFISEIMKKAGALVGLSVGDALGAAFEGLKPENKPVYDIIPGGVHKLKGGEVTDDTYLALAVAKSLIKYGKLVYDETALLMAESFRIHRNFFGPTSAKVFEAVLAGKSAFRISKEVYEAGGGRTDGSVMRGAPVGIFYSPAKVRTMSILYSQMTHYHPVACECSAFVNLMISCMCRGCNRREAYYRALSECRNEDVLGKLSQLKKIRLNPSIDALDATHCAVAFFMQGNSFEEAVSDAASVGGDTDTIAAITGALCGAEYGYSSIPERWLCRLIIREEIQKTAFELAEVSEK
ncbi:ADP-ribosylglycohydrolase family protein [Methanoplanus endosymbiosus]|uniref:ADP-ribosylglycohydrolase family protein n=1 Tax=Methanoplanus endosymbiosus TaxID=33865 RepID=A0A9E7PPS0_9EURY|nr:ADP-ribosylglycohydrolase family protein [Methanoplanus endosymbiosus]UUX92814.1 ADP-ribosylglycohydrolase family protein [Methanoplanus endosymbiosus]